jgi:hypothetical protein
VGITDERVSQDGGLVIVGQLHLGVEQKLSPDQLEFFWELCYSRQSIRAQRGNHPADPGTDTVTHNCETSTSVEELLSGKLVVGTGGRQVGDELVTTYKGD